MAKKKRTCTCEICLKELKELALRLTIYNEWRRGAPYQHPNPKQLGKDIDAAIMVINMLVDEANKNGAS